MGAVMSREQGQEGNGVHPFELEGPVGIELELHLQACRAIAISSRITWRNAAGSSRRFIASRISIPA
jgi:hypothetical protein